MDCAITLHARQRATDLVTIGHMFHSDSAMLLVEGGGATDAGLVVKIPILDQ